MAQKSRFKRLSLPEFADWLSGNRFDRQIRRIQNHHTFIPGYVHFKGDNHVALCEGMERSHLERGFAEIAQNLTIFPDGDVVLCRPFNTIPAGIKGANSDGLCIENLGNFDAGGDVMTDAQRDAIVKVNALLLMRFGLPCDSDHVLYHHWWGLDTGQRTNGSGSTKTCPGTAFFGGNTVAAAEANFLPLIAAAMGPAATPAAGAPVPRPGPRRRPARPRPAQPSQSGIVIANVANGAEVAVYEEINTWYRIHPSGQRWVNGRYVRQIDWGLRLKGAWPPWHCTLNSKLALQPPVSIKTLVDYLTPDPLLRGTTAPRDADVLPRRRAPASASPPHLRT